jgi:hypothetical protein
MNPDPQPLKELGHTLVTCVRFPVGPAVGQLLANESQTLIELGLEGRHPRRVEPLVPVDALLIICNVRNKNTFEQEIYIFLQRKLLA